MKKIPYSKFKHGQKVTCKIKETQIDDAKISIDTNRTIYICHNHADAGGAEADNKLGYKFSWRIFDNHQNMVSDHYRVTGLIFLDRSIEDVQEGDIVASKDKDERKVLGVCGECVFLSMGHTHTSYSFAISKHDLKETKYTIKQDTPPTLTEVTLQEVADKMGIPVEQLRIKE